MKAYGDNSERLSGINEFSYGFSDRTALVHIPPDGTYLEDRRPAADACSYQVLSALLGAIYTTSPGTSFESSSIYSEYSS